MDVGEAARGLAEVGLITVRVATGSMAPTLCAGETVLVRAAPPSVGDVVLLHAAGALTLHRLVARVGARWVHAGDAPGVQAGLCRSGDVLGVADLPRRPSPLVRRGWLTLVAFGRGALHRVMMR
ncbi:MAG TPA: S24/S26 family peptidase [Kofleriaceae bacterium]|nr:S24/S26 family peptidase [Kofleriaceae bacterium]